MEFVSDNCIRSASGRCDRAITDCLTDRRLVDWDGSQAVMDHKLSWITSCHGSQAVMEIVTGRETS